MMINASEAIQGRLIYVRYESLCLDPKGTLEELDSVLAQKGYHLDLSKTAHDTSWNSKRIAEEESASPLDGKPADTSSIGSFKGVLTDEVCNILGRIGNPLQDKTGMDWFCAEDMNAIAHMPRIIAA